MVNKKEYLWNTFWWLEAIISHIRIVHQATWPIYQTSGHGPVIHVEYMQEYDLSIHDPSYKYKALLKLPSARQKIARLLRIEKTPEFSI
jgi:hypothetical protein